MSARFGTTFVIAVARHLATVAAGLITVSVIGHRLGTDALGVWALLGTTAFLIGLSDLGTPVAAQRALGRGDPALARRAVRLGVTTILALALPTCALAAYWLSTVVRGIADGTSAMWLSLVAGVLLALASPMRGVAVITHGAMRGLAIARASAATAQIVVTLLVLWVTPSLLAPALGLVVAAALETGLTWRLGSALDPDLRWRPGLPRDRHELYVIARDASGALVINLAVAAAIRVDVALLAASGPLAIVAAYGVASRAVDQAFSVAKQVSAALLPSLRVAEERRTSVENGIAVLGGLAGAGLTSLVLCGRPLLVAWAGPAASTDVASLALWLLGGAAILAAVCELPAAALTIADRSAWRAATPIVAGAAVNVIIGVAGVRAFGPLAVASATVVGNLVMLVWTLRRASRLLSWTSCALVSALMPVGASVAVSAAVGGACRSFATAAWSSLAVCAVATAAGAGLGVVVVMQRSRTSLKLLTTSPAA